MYLDFDFGDSAVAAIEGCNEVFHAGLSAGILNISVMLSFLIFDSRPPLA